MKIELLRELAGKEEIDYLFLMSALSSYTRPRSKVSAWLHAGELIRIKKGLYIFGKKNAKRPYSPEVLANLIYGPSAISLHYALSFYGLIPERVMTVTSITNKRNKLFSTPIGEFTYRYLNTDKYAIGIEYRIQESYQFLIASPEKALCDLIYLTEKKDIFVTLDEVEAYLLQDLRLDSQGLNSFRINKLAEINHFYQDARLQLLIQFIRKWRH